MSRFLFAVAVLAAAVSFIQAEEPTPLPADQKPTIEELEQRIKVLERKQELDKEAAAAKEKEASKVAANAEGFTIRSADGAYALRIRGYVQADVRVYGNDVAVATTDAFLLRRVRPVLEAQLGKYAEARLTPDFGEGKATLYDAYADVKFAPWLKLRAGKFKPPLGLERLQSALDLAFVERALPTNLVPNRDVGIQLFGDVAGGVFAYQVGVFDGAPDGANIDGDTNDGKDVAARVFITPFKRQASSWLRDFGFGVFASSGSNIGTPTAVGLSGYKTAGQLTFFAYRAGTTPVVANGDRSRFGAQAQWQNGRVAVQAEWYRSSHDVKRTTTTATQEATLTHESGQATVQIMLTRDRATLRGMTPKRPFDPAAAQWGALELALRAGYLDVDEASFTFFADPDASAKAARELGIGVNWYLTKNLKIVVDGVQTRFDAYGTAAARETEKVLLSRVQIAF